LFGVVPVVVSAPAAHAADAPVMVHKGPIASAAAPLTMRWLGPANAVPAPTTTVEPPLPPTAAPATGPATTGPTVLSASVSNVRTAAADDPGRATYVVRRGDHLWSIAADALEDRLGHLPSTREVTSFWRSLIDANRDRLVDADNPDLLFAGQELVLPD
jgi:nucleoid-associated protein YgaU